MTPPEPPRDDALDAARYRWLRAHARTTGLRDPEGRQAWYLPGQTWAIRADTFDEAVDRLMAQDHDLGQKESA